jgi:hypothetical protein
MSALTRAGSSRHEQATESICIEEYFPVLSKVVEGVAHN